MIKQKIKAHNLNILTTDMCNTSQQLISILVNYPAIGPTYIQLYDIANKNQYLGRLLLTIDTDPIDFDIPKKPILNIIPHLLEVNILVIKRFVKIL